MAVMRSRGGEVLPVSAHRARVGPGRRRSGTRPGRTGVRRRAARWSGGDQSGEAGRVGWVRTLAVAPWNARWDARLRRPSASSRAAAARMRWRMDRWAGGPAEVGRRAGPSSDGARSGGKCGASAGGATMAGSIPIRRSESGADSGAAEEITSTLLATTCGFTLRRSRTVQLQRYRPGARACPVARLAVATLRSAGPLLADQLASLLGGPGRQDALGAACAALGTGAGGPGSGRLRCGSRLPRPARALRTRYRMDQASPGRNAAQAASAATVKPAHPPPHGCAPPVACAVGAARNQRLASPRQPRHGGHSCRGRSPDEGDCRVQRGRTGPCQEL